MYPPQQPEKRPEPTPPEFVSDRWYCLHCPVDPASEARFTGEYGAKTHLLDEHGIPKEEVEAGVDYAEAWQAKTIWRRRQREAAQVASAAARRLLDPNYTVEDFLTDAGDESWDTE